MVWVSPTKHTVKELRELAVGMPFRHEATKSELIAWLAEHRPEALTAQA